MLAVCHTKVTTVQTSVDIWSLRGTRNNCRRIYPEVPKFRTVSVGEPFNPLQYQWDCFDSFIGFSLFGFPIVRF